ncbi:MAG: hypothetical protein Q4A98_04950 [Comamonadaceae bacterium]|nr:hypothetical protein [Comamonadaceae bacterium]
MQALPLKRALKNPRRKKPASRHCPKKQRAAPENWRSALVFLKGDGSRPENTPALQYFYISKEKNSPNFGNTDMKLYLP